MPHLQPVSLCHISQDAHAHAWPREGVALDERLRHTQQPPNGTHLQTPQEISASFMFVQRVFIKS
jgi:hypothetical protein